MPTTTTAIDWDGVLEALSYGLPVGFCLACGHCQDPVEPDARRYRCHQCGQAQVYGAEELTLIEWPS